MTTDTAESSRFAPLEAGEPDTVANQAFGFWIYLMTDLVLFAALFATYTVLAASTAGGPTGNTVFHLGDVFKETLLLLTSSTTFGMVMLALQRGAKSRVLTWLAVTFLLGSGFIAMEIREFVNLIADGNGPGRSAFLSAYFTLVGTHGLHVTVGLFWILVMAAQVVLKPLTDAVQSRLLRLSMFWHFLDVVWVAIITVVYLKGVL